MCCSCFNLFFFLTYKHVFSAVQHSKSTHCKVCFITVTYKNVGTSKKTCYCALLYDTQSSYGRSNLHHLTELSKTIPTERCKHFTLSKFKMILLFKNGQDPTSKQKPSSRDKQPKTMSIGKTTTRKTCDQCNTVLAFNHIVTR